MTPAPEPTMTLADDRKQLGRLLSELEALQDTYQDDAMALRRMLEHFDALSRPRPALPEAQAIRQLREHVTKVKVLAPDAAAYGPLWALVALVHDDGDDEHLFCTGLTEGEAKALADYVNAAESYATLLDAAPSPPTAQSIVEMLSDAQISEMIAAGAGAVEWFEDGTADDDHAVRLVRGLLSDAIKAVARADEEPTT